MIKVNVSSNVKRETVFVEPTATLRSALEEAGIEPRGTLNLDGSPLGPGDVTKTFADYGYSDEEGKNKCYLVCIVKADNA